MMTKPSHPIAKAIRVHTEANPCLATDFPCVLKAWREKSGHKLVHVAGQLGVSPATWGHWEAGSRFPNATNLALLSALTGLSIPELLCANAHRCPYQANRRQNAKPYSK